MGDLRPLRFRVQNFRNVDDSGWIDLDRVTALVGKNESGKTALLQALHKFNPADPLPYVPQREFPRDRFQSEFTKETAGKIPVCSVEFSIEGTLRSRIDELSGTAGEPKSITFTRYYDGHVESVLSPAIEPNPIVRSDVEKPLGKLAQATRRIRADGEGAAGVEEAKGALLAWIATKTEGIPAGTLRTPEGRAFLTSLVGEVEKHAKPETAEYIESFLEAVQPLVAEAAKPPVSAQIAELCRTQMPVFIYFENYGILDSAIHLSRHIEDAARAPDDPRVRTISAMFKHVKLSAKELAELGRDPVSAAKAANRAATPDELAKDTNDKELRAIRLNAASIDITRKFAGWWHQRRHHIVYTADADFFRIWVSDEKRPNVQIELESRSKGFQWFFSFYLVFLVESEEEHRDAVLLLDEPGMHLHPTAQSELLTFFEELANKNQIIYTTHSPFLVDGKRLTRVRAVSETEDGRSRVSTDFGPADRDTLFPLQAAFGYDLAQTLFQGQRNVLVEGMSDLLYTYGFDLLARSNGKTGLNDAIYLTPSIGTKFIAILASIYTGQGARPLVLLDDDSAGQAKQKELVKELYKGEEAGVVFLSSLVAGCAETEDVVGEDLITATLGKVLGTTVKLTAADRQSSGVVDSVKAWATRTKTTLPEGWKLDVAWRIVRDWSEGKSSVAADLLERASTLVAALNSRVGTS